MGIFQRVLNKSKEEIIIEKTDADCVYAPMVGEVIPLEEIHDGVFSAGMLGIGCGLIPSEGKVYAPFDGEVILITPTKHAVALKSNEGIELLIHVGIDTVNMNGQGFQPLVKPGDIVKCGQLIMTFSISDIEARGYLTTSAIVVTNSEEYMNVSVAKQGETIQSVKMIQVS